MWFSKTLYSDEPAKGWLPWGLLAPVLGLVFVILGALPADLLLPHLGLVDDQGNFSSFSSFVLFLWLGFPIMGLVTLCWVKWVERRSFASLGLSRTQAGRRLLEGQALGIATSGLVVLSIGLVAGYRLEAWFPGVTSLANLAAIAWLLLSFTMQSGIEEILFRGWLFSVVTRKFNVLTGIILVGLLFTLLHFEREAPWYINFNSFLFSTFACYLVLYAQNLWLAMGWHAGWNWFMGTGFGIPITGIQIDLQALIAQLSPISDELITGGAGGPESSVLCSLFFVLASLALHLAIQRRGKAVPEPSYGQISQSAG